MSPINTMFIFIIICFTMSAVSCSHELRDVCTVEGDTLHCRWTGAGLYNTRIRLDVKKVVFERFFVAGQLDLANNRDLHSIEIKQGNSKCSNVLAAPETITIVNGIHCDNGVIASTTTTAATRVTPGSTLSIGTTDKQLKSTPHAQEEDKGLDNIKIILIMIFEYILIAIYERLQEIINYFFPPRENNRRVAPAQQQPPRILRRSNRISIRPQRLTYD
ncbi:uncharacterized protein LOC143078853 isoform X2 [Mytilus galloprovincialis]|uniref:MAM domain-containing protein n=3 Tax=Mytilus TaxID=6548 RepID=A0A8B6FTU2_MYTGA|nr:Hypothetical predicted protein [Mytilus galloprovincialis]